MEAGNAHRPSTPNSARPAPPTPPPRGGLASFLLLSESAGHGRCGGPGWARGRGVRWGRGAANPTARITLQLPGGPSTPTRPPLKPSTRPLVRQTNSSPGARHALPGCCGEGGPPRGRGGRNSLRQGFLGRLEGPGTWIPPRSPPPARPPSPRFLFSLRNSLQWSSPRREGMSSSFKLAVTLQTP